MVEETLAAVALELAKQRRSMDALLRLLAELTAMTEQLHRRIADMERENI